MKLSLDKWQQEVLDTKGNIVLRSGRQVGKSTVISIKAGDYAVGNKNKSILVIASVERQARLLFEKTLSYIYNNHRKMICSGKDRPTKHMLKLTNGSVIHCLPTGLSGYGIRGYTINLLIADEAAFIPEEVWQAVTPMLAVTQGDIILLSTPFGKGGYFYRCFGDPSFTSFHVSSENCPRIDEDFLVQEKKRMSTLEYAQEYLGEFVDELRRFFSDDVIQSCMKLTKKDIPYSPAYKRYLGVDVARMGKDDTVMFSVAERNGIIYQLDIKMTRKTRTTDTVRTILDLDNAYHYKRIYIDDGGMGVGVFDPLLANRQTRRRVEAINNASRGIDNDKRRKKLLKEDLYNNLLTLMEQGRIHLRKNHDTIQSLRSVQAEYVNNGLKIFGNYTHITEALIRACWCIKGKNLNIYIY